MAKGMVYLVGAGPGDPKLITVKGLECIKKADCLVYDRLASRRLLTYARPDCEMIYVGKSPDRHTLRQEEINQLLADKALEGKTVTRLKGGDPYVFGRGGEEAEVLRQHGIPFEVVPGITSAIAVPSYAGIPVTHRGVSVSFAVITGNEDPTKDESQIEWEKLATGIGTLIFLMGMSNLPLIVGQLVKYGRPAATPVALIRWGTRPEQQTLVGTLEDIVQKSQEAGFSNPAIIIVGEVVKLRDTLTWFEQKPLFGKRIVVTRSRAQASALSERIEDLGGEPWEFPTIDIQPPADYAPLDAAIGRLETYDWVVFTSVNGVEYFFGRLIDQGRDIRDLKGLKICAIGPETKKALTSRGLKVDLMPREFRAEAIIEGLQGESLAGKKFLLARADIARDVLPKSLAEHGAIVEDVVTYRTVLGGGDAAELQDLFREKAIHAVTFTSSSTVRNFVELMGGKEAAASLLTGVKVASIGPVTSATARELGIQVDAEAPVYTIDGLIATLLQLFE